MQSGFGMLEMGSAARGHEVNIMLKNVYDVVCGALAYYIVGFGISYGSPSNGFMGLGNFFVDASSNPTEGGLLFTSFIFQFSFAATSTTIVSGCLAMRCRFLVYCIYSFYSVIVYCFVAHWVWADTGWLRQLGAHDFAGSGPVHLLGAMNGLIGSLCVGPRVGRFDGTRPKSDFDPSSPASILFGLFMSLYCKTFLIFFLSCWWDGDMLGHKVFVGWFVSLRWAFNSSPEHDMHQQNHSLCFASTEISEDVTQRWNTHAIIFTYPQKVCGWAVFWKGTSSKTWTMDIRQPHNENPTPDQNSRVPKWWPVRVDMASDRLWWGWIGFNCGSSFGITTLKPEHSKLCFARDVVCHHSLLERRFLHFALSSHISYV